MPVHAKLSASGSYRWIHCPGSISAEEGYPDIVSSYAKEGILAHSVAEICLLNSENPFNYVNSKNIDFSITVNMAKFIQKYIDYIQKFRNLESRILVEKVVSYSRFVPEGFGTVDCVLLNSDVIHIFDFKYGRSWVNFKHNTQLQLYALGLYQEYSKKYSCNFFYLHIVQPRISNTGYSIYTKEQILHFGEWVTEKAKNALQINAPRIPGDKTCQWCKAKKDCPEFLSFQKSKDYENPWDFFL